MNRLWKCQRATSWQGMERKRGWRETDEMRDEKKKEREGLTLLLLLNLSFCFKSGCYRCNWIVWLKHMLLHAMLLWCVSWPLRTESVLGVECGQGNQPTVCALPPLECHAHTLYSGTQNVTNCSAVEARAHSHTAVGASAPDYQPRCNC